MPIFGISFIISCLTLGQSTILLPSELRILPTFADALRKKVRTRASFEKTLPNCISVESLIKVVFDKNIIYNFDFFLCEAPEASTNRNDQWLFD